MLSIQVFLTCQSKLSMNYKHVRQAERHQIHALMKAMSSVSDEVIRMNENRLDNRPRKWL